MPRRSSSTSSSSSSSSNSSSPKKKGGKSHSSKRAKAPKYQEPVDATGQLIVGDPMNLHIGDYIGFERIGTDREWNLSLGRVVSFPSSQTVKVLHYDPCGPNTVAQDPEDEKEIKKQAQKHDRMKVYHAREHLKKELQQAAKEESEASRKLFDGRAETLRKQQAANSNMTSCYSKLDAARKLLKEHLHLWCCLRSMIVPPTDMVPVVKALMLVIHEDKSISSWESMRHVMMRNDFFKRLMDTDCAMKPMSPERCDRLRELLDEKAKHIAKARAKKEKEEQLNAGTRKTTLKKVAGNRDNKTMREPEEETKKNNAQSRLHECNHRHHKHDEFEEDIGIMHLLDISVRRWIEVQIELSSAGEARNAIIDECFTEQQQQRVLLREVNDMRANISRLEEEMLSKKKLILGAKEQPDVLKLEMKDYNTSSTFHRRTYADYDGRYVQEVVLRCAVIANFGALVGCENDEGYLKLGKQQTEMLRHRVYISNIVHDADTMEDLLNITDQNEKELAELQSRIDALRSKGHLSPEEAEELSQLTAVHEERDRQYRATLARIAHMYACCRGARDITVSDKKNDTKYLRLGLKWFGRWSGVSRSCKAELEREVAKDLIEIAPLDLLDNVVIRIGQTDLTPGQWRALHRKRAAAKRLLGKDVPLNEEHLIVNFNVKYTGPLSEGELIHQFQHGAYPNLEAFFAKHQDGAQTYPINTIQQETDCAEAVGKALLRDLPENFNANGSGVVPKRPDYFGQDGTDVMHFDSATEGDPDFRKSKVYVKPTREDFDESLLPPASTECTFEENRSQSPKQEASVSSAKPAEEKAESPKQEASVSSAKPAEEKAESPKPEGSTAGAENKEGENAPILASG